MELLQAMTLLKKLVPVPKKTARVLPSCSQAQLPLITHSCTPKVPEHVPQPWSDLPAPLARTHVLVADQSLPLAQPPQGQLQLPHPPAREQ